MKTKKKTNKSAAKRFRRTARGKITYRKPGAGHLLSSKSRKRKRALGRPGVLSKAETKQMHELLGLRD